MTIPAQLTPLIRVDSAANDRVSDDWYEWFGTVGSGGGGGNTVLNGAGAPSGGTGSDGDFYINTSANTIYGPKTAGAWGSPTSLVGPTGAAGAGMTWTEAEIDFGSTPVYDATFTITDAAITSSAKKVIVNPCGKAATGRTADDWQWDGAVFAANPGTGSATVYATFSPGPIVGKRKIQYSVVA